MRASSRRTDEFPRTCWAAEVGRQAAIAHCALAVVRLFRLFVSATPFLTVSQTGRLSPAFLRLPCLSPLLPAPPARRTSVLAGSRVRKFVLGGSRPGQSLGFRGPEAVCRERIHSPRSRRQRSSGSGRGAARGLAQAAVGWACNFRKKMRLGPDSVASVAETVAGLERGVIAEVAMDAAADAEYRIREIVQVRCVLHPCIRKQRLGTEPRVRT